MYKWGLFCIVSLLFPASLEHLLYHNRLIADNSFEYLSESFPTAAYEACAPQQHNATTDVH